MTFKAAHLPTRMSLLARKHYNLRSTSITGIPMKVIIIIIIKRIIVQDVHFNELKTAVINVCPVLYALNLQLNMNLIKDI